MSYLKEKELIVNHKYVYDNSDKRLSLVYIGGGLFEDDELIHSIHSDIRTDMFWRKSNEPN